MANKVDVRIVKSKESLMNALVNLLSKKKLEDLTISEICQEADVNRNTFYSHYTSIRELFEEMRGKYLESLLSSTKVFDEPSDSALKSLTTILDKMKDKGELTRIVFSEANASNFLNNILKFYFPQTIIHNHRSNYFSLEECHSFIIGGISYIIIQWIENGFQESPKFLARKINNFIEEINEV